MQKILFRADSSSSIGTGHIMRDLVLAKQYVASEIIFATQQLEGNINHKIIESGYKVQTLLSNNLDELILIVFELSIDILVIDHYAIDYEFEKAIKEKFPTLKILCFDDLYEKHCCDIVLNHNVCADKERYDGLVPKDCEIRCGSKYTLLRDEFIREKKNTVLRKERNNVFISIGGTDHSHINIKILESIKKFNFTIDLVTTTANQNLDELVDYCKKNHHINLHINSKEIAKLINYSLFTIITPSVVANEVLYMNRPVIAIQTAPNQDEMYKYFVKNNILVQKKFDSKNLVKLIDEVQNAK